MTIDTKIDLEQLRLVNPDKVDRNELVDIQDITVDVRLAKEERVSISEWREEIGSCKSGRTRIKAVNIRPS